MIIIITLLVIYTIYIVTFKDDYIIKDNVESKEDSNTEEKEKKLSGDELYEKILWSNVVLIVILMVISVAFNV